MKRFIVLVLDGFGIGEMDDVKESRPADTNSNTCLHIYKSLKNFSLPTLEKLGLLNALQYSIEDGNASSKIQEQPMSANAIHTVSNPCYSFHNLAHFGADTFWGHQELLGSKPKKAIQSPFSHHLQEVKNALELKGYTTRLYPEKGPQIIVVNEAMVIGDNLETDLGNNFNITAALDVEPFETVRIVGKIVRNIVKVSRVIAFGAPEVTIENILNAYEKKDETFAGVSAPKSGVYKEGYQVVHMGYGVEAETQVPAKLASKGIKTILIGKVADIAENQYGENLPAIDTKEVLDITANAMDELQEGFICANVQETDLAGHKENTELYAQRLTTADNGIETIIKKLKQDDILVITADHGNDPTIGHPQHTREKTPLLVYGQNIKPGKFKPRKTLSDTAATVADFFGAQKTEAGTSYLNEILGETK